MFFRKSKDSAVVKKLQDKIQRRTLQRNFYLQGFQAMLQLLDEFVLDRREIDADSFKKQIDLLRRKLDEERDVKSLTTFFKQLKESVLQFIQKQKKYIDDRDAEMRQIIDVMTKAIATQNDENRQYHKSIYQHSEKIERITQLDDLRKIRTALEKEIMQIRSNIEAKQAKEKDRMKALGQEINSLSRELKKAKAEALTDALTGLSNRKAFDQLIVGLSRKSSLGNHTFALLLLDIDDFKKINDTYGHQVGDDILVLIGEKCRENVRSNDFIGRYGGEEFVMVLPSSSLKNAVKKGRQLKKAIEKIRYKYRMDGENSGITLRITVSIGVSAFKKGDTVKHIIERADKALYAAKDAGKNQIITEKDLS